MKVVLLQYTPEPANLAEISAKTCYSSLPPSEIKASDKKVLLKQIVESGHHSVLEHAVFTFSIEGVSRATTHQLVRHRIASYSQQSQRYVAEDKIDILEDFVLPDSVKDACNIDGGCLDAVTGAIEQINNVIEVLRKNGVPEEDIRYFYPNGLKTNIVVTMNARELLHFFNIRCCNRAQWEIRLVANSMLNICKEVCPEIFENAGPNCVANGKCTEKISCQTH